MENKKCKKCGSSKNVYHYLIEFSKLYDYNINNEGDENETFVLSGRNYFCEKCVEEFKNIIFQFFN